MRFLVGLVALMAVPCGILAQDGTAVTIDGLSSRTPPTWKENAPPQGAMLQSHIKQFTLPRAEWYEKESELIVSFFGSGQVGGVRENVARWKGMFQPPEGKTAEDITKTEELAISGAKVTYVDISGTYLEKFPPFAPNAKITPRP